MEPIPKNPSTVFMIEVCSAVDRTISPIRASAPVLKIAIATPDKAISTQKNRNDDPARKRNDAAANNIKPIRIVVFRPNRSARCPRRKPATAIPDIVAY
jgi:hypothetical protein